MTEKDGGTTHDPRWQGLHLQASGQFFLAMLEFFRREEPARQHEGRKPDPNFWSIRVSRDVRLIVHKTGTSLLLCYVNHHDEAYQWAERRKVETHPKTGAAQLVEIRERVQEITVPKYVEAETKPKAKPPLFSALSDDQLLSFGVPREWLSDARSANEDSVLDLAEHLPAEAP